MIVLQNHNIVYFDVDGTLIETVSTGGIKIECIDFVERVVPHTEHIEHLRRLRNRGYGIVVWSQRGYDWADAVVRALKIDGLVDVVLSKPLRHYDDLPATEWMGPRLYMGKINK
jgi:phosphoglycolate phosphatase-like HAD superfamily hydrolase